MKFTYNWLKEYVALDWLPEELTERLTMAGIEVERVEKIGGGFDGVVVAQILASEKHPNADRLSVCRVNDGKGERQIVCGAKNYKVGDKVPLAMPGTKLPNGITIKESRLRDVLSQGMLCSATELGLGTDADGLMILSPDAPVGKPFGEFLGGSDVIFDVEITPNRPDWLGVIGIAREVAALTGGQICLPKVQLQETGEPVANAAFVRVEAPDLCPRYVARVIRGVKIAPSPDWLKTKLQRVGLRPINNVVDVTNFVMLEIGQPLHAFDYNLLEGRGIIVRRAANEKLTLIDGSERQLSNEMLVIADAKKPVALAGIMGGKHSEISEATTDVLLESACFEPRNIRATSKQIGVSSDSSYRFERGADIGVADWASQRAAALIQQLAGGQICRGAIDTLSMPVVKRRVSVRFEKINRILGVEVPAAQAQQFLNGLGLSIVEQNAQQCVAEIPTFRVDIEREEDLVEEVCRIYGVDKIAPAAPSAKPSVSEYDETVDAYNGVRQMMLGLGFSEAVNQTLIAELNRSPRHEEGESSSDADQNRHLTSSATKSTGGDAYATIKLQNALAADQTILRSSLLTGLLGNLRVNVSRRNDDVRLFEIGRVFACGSGKPVETTMLSLAITGRRAPVFWEGVERDEKVNFFDLKGAVETLAAQLGVQGLEFVTAQTSEGLFENGGTRSAASDASTRSRQSVTLHAVLAQSAGIQLKGTIIGLCGMVSPAVSRQFDLRDAAYVAELQLDTLLAAAEKVRRYEPLPMFPAIRRDVAMIVDEAVTHAQVMAVIRDFKNKLLVQTDVFDVFRGKNIPEGKKSVAYSMTYRATDRTLTDDEVNKAHEKLKQLLKEKLQAEIRE
jgi:phenylalanyl-tRNA synthetase beta chain